MCQVTKLYHCHSSCEGAKGQKREGKEDSERKVGGGWAERREKRERRDRDGGAKTEEIMRKQKGERVARARK